MKSVGIVRKLDELGRIVLPIELRKTFGMQNKDMVEIYVQEDMIILKKYDPSCIFCSSSENIKDFENRNICQSCIEKLKNKK